MYCKKVVDHGEGHSEFDARGWFPTLDILQQIARAVVRDVCR